MARKILIILVGAALGVACKYVCDALIRALLSKREKEYSESKTEKICLFVIMAVFGALIMLAVPLSPETLFMFLLLIVCEAVAVIDMHTRLIPNELILSVLALAVVFGVPGLLGLRGFPAWKPLPALIGLVVCFLIFLLPAVFSKQVGAGDIKLAAAMGFCVGLWNSLFIIVLMGILVLIYVFLQHKAPILKFMASTIPMGPFLAVSMIAVLLAMKLPLLADLFSGMPF